MSLLVGGTVIATLYMGYTCVRTPGNLSVNILKTGVSLIPGAFLLLMAWLTQKIGWADGIVLLILGLVQGFQRCVVLLCLSMLLTALVSMVLLVLRRVNRHSSLPYLPFLTVTYLVGILMRGG